MGQEEPYSTFRYLSHDEFAALTKDQKIEYLARAIRAVARDKDSSLNARVFIIKPTRDAAADGT